MVGSPWDGLIVVCGASWWEGTPLLEHHVAEELTCYAPVLYVDPPSSLLTRFRNHDARSFAHSPGLRTVHDRLAVLSIRVPPLMERPVVKELALTAVRRGIRSGVRKLGAERVHALVVPNLEPLFGSAGERHRVLYVKDDYVAGARLTGLPSRRLHRLSERLPQEADTVVAVSQVLADGLRNSGIETLLIPNGVDVAVFKDAGVPSAGGDAPPVTAFVGHLSERVDVALLTAVADRGMRIRMIGPPQETMKEGHLGPLQGHPNVEWAGRVAYSQLGRALSDVTTCVLPYGNTAFNRASFPLKILEYLAAGRRVVSTDLPSARWLDTPLVDRADSVEDFAGAVERSLASPLTVTEIAERRAFAEQHSWAARTRLLADRLGLVAQATETADRHGAGVP